MTMMTEIFNETIYEIDHDKVQVSYAQRPETYIVPILFWLIFIVGIVGNTILIFIVLRHKTTRNNITNIYLLSLALGDFMVILFSVPSTSYVFPLKSWPWGTVICKLFECAQDIAIGASVFSLTALSSERYHAAVRPISHRFIIGLNTRPTIIMVCIIWVLAIILAVPAAFNSNVISYELHENYSISICTPFPEELGSSYEKGMVLFKFFVYYVIPLCVIAAFYLDMAWQYQHGIALSTRNMPGELPGGDLYNEQIKARKKVGQTVIGFLIVFMLCYLPYQVFMLWFHFSPTASEDYNDAWHVFRIIGFCLNFSCSCVNPISIYLINSLFRERFNEYLCCFLPNNSAIRGRNRTDNNTLVLDTFLQRQRTLYSTSMDYISRKKIQQFDTNEF